MAILCQSRAQSASPQPCIMLGQKPGGRNFIVIARGNQKRCGVVLDQTYRVGAANVRGSERDKPTGRASSSNGS